MSTNSNIRLCKSMARPVLTYAWGKTSRTKMMLRSVKMRSLRFIRGVTPRDQIRFTQSRRKYWSDYVDIMGTVWYMGKGGKRTKSTSKRLPGRPLKRWFESWISTFQEN